MRVQISMPDDLMAKVDETAKHNFTSRSGLIALACRQYCLQSELTSATVEVARCLRVIAERNELDQETKDKIDTLCNFFALYKSETLS